jgi:hypothetical protein
MRRRAAPLVAIPAFGLALTIALVRIEHRRSSVPELWIVSQPGGHEVSVQRTEDTGSWAAFRFDDRGANTLLVSTEGTRPVPRPTPVNDRGVALA